MSNFKSKLTKIATDYIHMQGLDNRIQQVLEDAIEHQTKVSIQYGSSMRIISPFGWGTSKDGNVTVKAYDEEGNVKSFTANKITKITPRPNDVSTKQKYNETIKPSTQFDEMQNQIDKKYKGEDRMIAKNKRKRIQQAKLRKVLRTKLGQNEVLEEITFSIIEDIRDRLFEDFEFDQVSPSDITDILEDLISSKYEDMLMQEGYEYRDISDVIEAELPEIRTEHNNSIDNSLAPLDETASKNKSSKVAKKQTMKRLVIASEEFELSDAPSPNTNDFEVKDIEIDTNSGTLTVMMKNLHPEDYDLLYAPETGSEFSIVDANSPATTALMNIIKQQGYGKYLKQAKTVIIWFE